MMKQMNGNISDLDESGLLPYHVIVAATRGDPDAMKRVMQHYEGVHRVSVRSQALRRTRQYILRH